MYSSIWTIEGRILQLSQELGYEVGIEVEVRLSDGLGRARCFCASP